MAHCDICFVSADHDLIALGNDVHICIKSSVDGSLRSAGADGLDLGDRVRNLEKAAASREQMREEVGTQAEA